MFRAELVTVVESCYIITNLFDMDALKALLNDYSNYSQIDKEALAVIFLVEKLNRYLWVIKFKLLSDCKPLVSVYLVLKRGYLYPLTESRLHGYAVIRTGYNFEMSFIISEKN